MDKKNKSEKIMHKCILNNIKNINILKGILKHIKLNISYKLMKYNKKIQERLNLALEDFKTVSEIEIELIPVEGKNGKFINILKKEEESYFHIYFDDNKKEIKRNYLYGNENIKKINIVIEYEVKSFYKLFEYCQCVESINFKKFHLGNINNMSCMFFGCSSLKEISLSNFNTSNVTDMSSMFYGCLKLKKLDLSKFDTKNLVNMSNMFNGCSSLRALDLSNFNTDKVIDMNQMFNWCSSLKYLKLFTINSKSSINMNWMFNGCSKELKALLKYTYFNIKDEAFL